MPLSSSTITMLLDASDSGSTSGVGAAEITDILSENPDVARELRHANEVRVKAALAYLSDNVPLVCEALIGKALAGDVSAIKLLFETLGIKPMRWRAPKQIDEALEGVGGESGTGEELSRILDEAEPVGDGSP